MKKMYLLLAVFLVWATIFTGCADDSQTDLIDESNIEDNVQEEDDPAENNQEEDQNEEMKTDSGSFQGQADSNFIEIKISGVPDEIGIKTFMLSDEIKEKFGQLALQLDEEIRFNYYENENQQLVIVEIEKM